MSKEIAYEFLLVGSDGELYRMIKPGETKKLSFWEKIKLLFA